MSEQSTPCERRRAGPTVEARIAQTARVVDQALADDLDRWLGGVPGRLAEAIRYSLLGGGKRLRPALVLWSAELVGCGRDEPGELALAGAVAIEMLHTYSLVHDDLPAMDDDDLRRGRPTCHKVFGEGLAVLVGDALLTRSFEALARAAGQPERIAAMIACLAEAGGAGGMIGGQAEDLAHQGQPGDLSAVERIHERKTAALFAAACRLGALAAGGDARSQEALGQFGRCLGLAFQITDDLLDETGQTARLGKRAGKDRSAGKLTYVSVAGVEASRNAACSWIQRGQEALDSLTELRSSRLEDLRALGPFVIQRTR